MDTQMKNAKNIENKFVLIIICLFFTVFQSCTPKKLSDQITDHINNMNIQNDSIHYLNLSEITSFKWDTLYVFSGRAHLKDVENILELKYPGIKSISTSWVFIQNRKIVYYEELCIISESDGNDIQVFFDVPDSTIYKIYTNQEFKIKRESLGLDYDGKYIRYIYNLNQ